MPKVLPWSHTTLDAFKNCPRAFHRRYVVKDLPFKPSPEMQYGREVHKAFEDYAKLGTELPSSLSMHSDYLKYLCGLSGENSSEQKISLNVQVKPCGYFDKDVWYRGAIDFKNLYQDQALIVDYKTGKSHSKFEQLLTFALWTFIAHPHVQTVDARYYWTKEKKETGKAWGRADIPSMWAALAPDLKQYVEAFQYDIWTPRQSGLCREYCDVLDCEFNGKGRS